VRSVADGGPRGFAPSSLGCAVALSGFKGGFYSEGIRQVLRGGKSRRTVSRLLLKGGAGLM
jgi:hypothetical protein